MAKTAQWGFGVRGKLLWSSKRLIVIVCSVNVLVALYFLYTVFSYLASYSHGVSRNGTHSCSFFCLGLFVTIMFVWLPDIDVDVDVGCFVFSRDLYTGSA